MSIRAKFILTGLLIAHLAVFAAIVAPAAAQEGNSVSSDGLAISVSESEVSTVTGGQFKFTSEITNEGGQETTGLVVHLNVVSLDRSVYVDPEDWSPRRTIGVSPISQGSSATQSWTINPVLEGDVSVYVVVLPDSGVLAAEGTLVASPAIQVHVEGRRNLNPGGVLPVALAVPGTLMVLTMGLMLLRRRGRSHA